MYSNVIFAKGNALGPTEVSGLIGGVSFVTTLFGTVWLVYAGRRPILIIGQLMMGLSMIAAGLCSNAGEEGWTIAFVMIFVTGFEVSAGPVTLMYMAEIMQDEAMGVAVMLLQIATLAITGSVPLIIDSIGVDNIGYIFLVFGISTTLAALFSFCFMHETKGKTPEQIGKLFVNESAFKRMRK